MEQLTYDPVLDSQPLPRWRLLNPLRPPVPGKALVLVPERGPALTIGAGEEVPAARFGAYQSVFTVDMTEHRLTLDIPLLSKDATFSFRSRVELMCRVADPAEVVARGIRDMSGALYGHIRRMLRKVSREFDIASFHEAEEALHAAVRDFRGDSAVRLRNVQVELLVDEDEIATSGRAFRDVERETRLDGMRRGRHLGLIREEGVEGLIAEIVEKEGARAALDRIEKTEAERREAKLAAMRMILERGDASREPFEQAELERTAVEEVLAAGDTPFGGARRPSRLKGALTDGGESARAAGTGDDAEPPAEGSEVLRSEILPRGGDAPPEDEPVPGGPVAPARPEEALTGPETGPRATARGGKPSRRVSRVRGAVKRPGGGGER